MLKCLVISNKIRTLSEGHTYNAKILLWICLIIFTLKEMTVLKFSWCSAFSSIAQKIEPSWKKLG